MRLLNGLLIAGFVTAAQPAFAVTAAEWQQQLQASIDLMVKTEPLISTTGQVSVREEKGSLLATLPAMRIAMTDASHWNVEPILFRATTPNSASSPLTVTMPYAFKRIDTQNREVARVNLGSQNVTGTWDFTAQQLKGFQGTFGKVVMSDDIAHSKADIASMTVVNELFQKLRFGMTGVNIVTDNPQANSLTANKLNVNYTLPEAKNVDFTSLFSLMQPELLVKKNGPLNAELTIENGKMASSDAAQVSKFDSLTSSALITPFADTDMVTMRHTVKLTNLSQTPGKKPMTDFVPRHLTVTGTVTKMPMSLLTFIPDQPSGVIKSQLAEAGTRADIDEMKMEMANGTKVSGTGWLMASDKNDKAYVGHLNLRGENLQSVLTTLQKDMAAPTTDLGMAQGQTMLFLMMLQGMGKQEGTATTYAVDFTPEGQTLINGQNMSGLLKMGQGLMPKTPVPSPGNE